MGRRQTTATARWALLELVVLLGVCGAYSSFVAAGADASAGSDLERSLARGPRSPTAARVDPFVPDPGDRCEGECTRRVFIGATRCVAGYSQLRYCTLPGELESVPWGCRCRLRRWGSRDCRWAFAGYLDRCGATGASPSRHSRPRNR